MGFIDTGFQHFCNILLRESDFIFKNLCLFLFSLDLFCFCVGYVTEAAFLNNKIRTCEISFAGIFFCLLCYPPFNDVTGTFVGWAQNDSAVAFNNHYCATTIILRIIAIFFLTIYSLASVALGTKASNLTNRGTVSIFPYNIIRHPAYVSKLTFWLFTTIPVFCIPLADISADPSRYFTGLFLAVISFLTWAFIYYMRALTEERHLLHDPEYQKYTEKVKYKFIPGLF